MESAYSEDKARPLVSLVAELVSSPAPTLRELLVFIWKEAQCCLFPLVMMGLVAITKIVSVPGIPRYDFILLASVAVQWAMVRFRLETRDELKVVCVFHLVGLGLELFKVQKGSWEYPEFAYAKVAGVPLYAGFMYASVASYMCQAWKRFALTVQDLPRQPFPTIFAALVYGNFFWSHFWSDLRWLIIAIAIIVFWRTTVQFTVLEVRRQMPLNLAFALIGFFIWVSENIQTFLGAWMYPHQASGWEMVHVSKILSWSLLVIVSFVIVAELKIVKNALNRKK